MKLKKIFLGIAVAAVAGVNVYKVNSGKTEQSLFCSLENLEAQACCVVGETSTGWIEWCWCDGVGYCFCEDGRTKGRTYYS